MDTHQFKLNSGITKTVVGIALNGVPIVSGTSELGFDALYPKAYGENTQPRGIDLDLCLGTADYSRFYHYYSFSPCIMPSKIKAITTAEMCEDDVLCDKNKF